MKKIILGVLLFFATHLVYADNLLHQEDFSQRPYSSLTSALYRKCCAFGYDVKYYYLPGITIQNLVDRTTLQRPHTYGGSLFEDNGQVYTCEGGFIDTGHLRDAVDWTAHVAQRLLRILPRGGSISFPEEGTLAFQTKVYPYDDPLTDELVVKLAQRIVFEYLMWHEVYTWYYTSYFFDQRHSAFSMEDIYSNLLGTFVGAQALLSQGNFADQVSSFLNDSLQRLGSLSIPQTKNVMDQVEGPKKWWDKDHRVIPDELLISKRNLDYADEIVPWLAPVRIQSCNRGGDYQSLEIPYISDDGHELNHLYETSILVNPLELTLPIKSKNNGFYYTDQFVDLFKELKKEVIDYYGEQAVVPYF